MTHLEHPTAEVTVRKSRIKKYGEKVYLKNGQEFEIELFNPLDEDILAKIKLNGKYISNSGIVLRPGERVFLDRYLDNPEKFLFSTYEVGNSKAVAKAIENNGDLEITFHREYVSSPDIWISGNTTYIKPWYPSPNYGPYTVPYTDPNIFYCSDDCGTTSDSNLVGASFTTNCGDSNIRLDSVIEKDKDQLSNELKDQLQEYLKKGKEDKKKETGKVEAGSRSDQKFNYVDKTFQSWSFCDFKYKILPESERLVATSDFRSYCTGCGKKGKKGHNFCSLCGKKL